MEIRLENVNKSFGKIKVLTDVNIKFSSGKIYGLYGRNGSGKSVLLKIISGLYSHEGKVLYDNVEYEKLSSLPFLRGQIETPSFFPNLTGLENLRLLAKIQNRISDEEILKSLDIVNLLNEKDKRYSEYSLGMKQKLGIAQAIMENPDIIILDEPFNGIENATVKKLIEYFKRIKKDKIIIVSTHIIEDLKNLCDKIYYLDGGVLREKEL